MNPRIETVAVDCLLLRLFDAIDEAHMPWMLAAASTVRDHFGPHLIDLVPSYTTLMVHYDLQALSEVQARERLNAAVLNLSPNAAVEGARHVLPVWYHDSVGPELPRLARRTGMSVEEVIACHTSRDYQVFALGFVPGFAFMGLVDEALATPRLNTPRKRVTAGSVAIAERQTSAYPVVSPGGWNVLGRTPAPLFDRKREGYSLLLPGDSVRFESVSHAEFLRLGGDDSPMQALP